MTGCYLRKFRVTYKVLRCKENFIDTPGKRIKNNYYYNHHFSVIFKSNVRETWRVILVSEADIFLSESLRILAERLSQSEIGLPLRQICYYSPPKEVGVFSTEIKEKW